MQQYCIYNNEGKILQYGTAPLKDVLLQIPPGEFQILLPAGFIIPTAQYYINENAEHTQCEDYDLSTLPIPCLIEIEGTEYSVTETPTFTFDAPGTYDLYISPVAARYRDKVINFEYST